jgi:hypothetical protein
MRSIEEVHRVLTLIEHGMNDCEIERQTGIPRRTVSDWRHGRIPGRTRTDAAAGCPECGHPEHDFAALPKAAYAYLLGLYLGDGCISKGRRGVFRLRITLDRKYPGIISECSQAMREVLPTSRVGVVWRRDNARDVSSWSRAWPCLLPQHGEGRKHLRRIELMDWQLEIVDCEAGRLLRGLVHSDGSYSANTIKHPKKTYVYPRYSFSNRSAEIREIFCDACDRLGIAWRVMNEFNISVAHRESVATMDRFVGPKA